MKQGLTFMALGMLGCLGFLLAVEATLAAGPPQENMAGLGSYRPPVLGAPRLRIGGGVRGTGDGGIPLVQVLAPRQAGQTTLAQPTLYWHLDQPTPQAVEITIMAEGAVSPLLREILPGPVAAGLHAFRLTDGDKRLERGVGYNWFVAVIVQPKQRSRDALACGGLLLVEAPVGLAEQVRDLKGSELGTVYARAGLWYEAINALVEGQSEGAGQLRVAAQFASILKQEEITGVPLTKAQDDKRP